VGFINTSINIAGIPLMAHIRKRGNVWWIYYYENGKLKGRSLRTRLKREAQAMKRMYESALDAGEPVPDVDSLEVAERGERVAEVAPRLGETVQPFDILDEVEPLDLELSLGPSPEPEGIGANEMMAVEEVPDAEALEVEAEPAVLAGPGWVHVRKSEAAEPEAAAAVEPEPQDQRDEKRETPSPVEWEREETASANLDLLEGEEEKASEPEPGEQGWLF